MSDIARNKQNAKAYLELISKGDAQGVANLFVDDGRMVIESRTLLPPEVRGKDNIKAMIGSLPQMFPKTGLKIFVDEITAEDNRVAIVAHSVAEHVSGKSYNNRYHFLIRFDNNGKITASHEYLDSLLLTEVFFDGQKPPAA